MPVEICILIFWGCVGVSLLNYKYVYYRLCGALGFRECYNFTHTHMHTGRVCVCVRLSLSYPPCPLLFFLFFVLLESVYALQENLHSSYAL